MDFNGTAGNDQYLGTPGADRIHGNAGQDQLRGASGDDEIAGGNGPDSLYGDQGHDTIQGDAGDDLIRGGRGNDHLRGGDGIDVVFGDRDDDILSGGAEGDVLFGGLGNDTILGDEGADIINGGDGIDTVDYKDSPWDELLGGVRVSLGGSTPNGTGSRGDAEGDILIDIEKVIGTEGADWLDAAFNNSDDVLYGDEGNDELRGGGSDSYDYLDGGLGDDHLIVTTNGTLHGGPGNDIFDFRGTDFKGAEIKDFTKGEDTIELNFDGKAISDADLENMLRNSQGNVLDLSLLGLDFEDFGELTLNVPVSILDASDFFI